jgi:uncharacterized protein (DUF2147 family)
VLLTSSKFALLFAILGSSVGAGITAAQPTGQDRATPTGVWLTASGNLEVNVAPCGAALCGTVVRVEADRAMGQTSSNDAGRPALGLTILQNFTPSGDGEWYGQIYNRDNGKTYSCIITLAAADTLEVRPYKLLPLFGQTQIWHRVDEKTGLR